MPRYWHVNVYVIYEYLSGFNDIHLQIATRAAQARGDIKTAAGDIVRLAYNLKMGAEPSYIRDRVIELIRHANYINEVRPAS
jgi:hypothetical protein